MGTISHYEVDYEVCDECGASEFEPHVPGCEHEPSELTADERKRVHELHLREGKHTPAEREEFRFLMDRMAPGWYQKNEWRWR